MNLHFSVGFFSIFCYKRSGVSSAFISFQNREATFISIDLLVKYLDLLLHEAAF